ncbi:hypothetical protein GGS23DRAFT_401367 [Durotheca rogersii]|uniref:uncharacterized protein n=1 Tax=Durotheca rogersii TaxID=419775 RepID=UPI002220D008|nr:uncharacterized protein GGS23DRAFT_401367 [Durotheca rogersii]KAI5864961.1 hypothetical protein GGS23DRAFT_401367 [Durotheca rogersii]
MSQQAGAGAGAGTSDRLYLPNSSIYITRANNGRPALGRKKHDSLLQDFGFDLLGQSVGIPSRMDAERWARRMNAPSTPQSSGIATPTRVTRFSIPRSRPESRNHTRGFEDSGSNGTVGPRAPYSASRGLNSASLPPNIQTQYQQPAPPTLPPMYTAHQRQFSYADGSLNYATPYSPMTPNLQSLNSSGFVNPRAASAPLFYPYYPSSNPYLQPNLGPPVIPNPAPTPPSASPLWTTQTQGNIGRAASNAYAHPKASETRRFEDHYNSYVKAQEQDTQRHGDQDGGVAKAKETEQDLSKRSRHANFCIGCGKKRAKEYRVEWPLDKEERLERHYCEKCLHDGTFPEDDDEAVGSPLSTNASPAMPEPREKRPTSPLSRGSSEPKAERNPNVRAASVVDEEAEQADANVHISEPAMSSHHRETPPEGRAEEGAPRNDYAEGPDRVGDRGRPNQKRTAPLPSLRKNTGDSCEESPVRYADRNKPTSREPASRVRLGHSTHLGDFHASVGEETRSPGKRHRRRRRRHDAHPDVMPGSESGSEPDQRGRYGRGKIRQRHESAGTERPRVQSRRRQRYGREEEPPTPREYPCAFGWEQPAVTDPSSGEEAATPGAAPKSCGTASHRGEGGDVDQEARDKAEEDLAAAGMRFDDFAFPAFPGSGSPPRQPRPVLRARRELRGRRHHPGGRQPRQDARSAPDIRKRRAVAVAVHPPT